MATVYLARDVRHQRQRSPCSAVAVIAPGSIVSAHHLTGAYDVSPDGRRFLMSSAKNQGLTLILVENWFYELKRGVP